MSTATGRGAAEAIRLRTNLGRYGGLVLTLLRKYPGLSRTGISERTGLSPTTVTKAVAPLLERGYLAETGNDAEARIGRPAIGLRLVPEAVSVCGIQVGVGTVRAALVDALGRPQRTIAFGFSEQEDARAVLAQVADRIQKDLLATTGSKVIAIGVGAPGPVDADHRVNLLSVNLGWREVPVADVLERACELPVTTDHNVRAMALAESRFGHQAHDIAFVHAKTGVGLGLVLKDEPFFGGHHGVSELGHVQVVENGDQCPCGARGCLETVAAEPALVRSLREAGVPAAGDPLAVIDRASFSEPAVAEVRGRFLRRLAVGLANVVNLLNPELIVVGGMLANASDAFLADLEAETVERVFPLLRDSFRVRRTSFGENAGTVGAAATALEAFFYTTATD